MKRVSKSAAQDLVARGALLVDMRSPVAYRDGHVTGAVNLPLLNFVNRIMAMERKSKIIIYSDDANDAILRQGNTYAETLGFVNIYYADYLSLTQDAVAPPPKPKQKPRRGK